MKYSSYISLFLPCVYTNLRTIVRLQNCFKKKSESRLSRQETSICVAKDGDCLRQL